MTSMEGLIIDPTEVIRWWMNNDHWPVATLFNLANIAKFNLLPLNHAKEIYSTLQLPDTSKDVTAPLDVLLGNITNNCEIGVMEILDLH